MLIERHVLLIVPSCRQSDTCELGASPIQRLLGKSKTVTGCYLAPKLERRREKTRHRSAHQRFRGQQELLWRRSFLDPTPLWRNWPECTRTQSKDVLWQNNVNHPASVKSQLAMGDPLMEDRISRAPSSLPKSPWLFDPGSSRTVGYGGEVTVEACSRLCEEGQLVEAVDALGLLVKTRGRVPTALFYSVLKGCLAEESLVLGRRVHALALNAGYQSNTFLANHILRIYASHGRLQEAREVFSQVTAPDTFMWNSIISAHTKCGQPNQAINLYREMCQSTVKPNSYVFVAVLTACASAEDLASGKEVHANILVSGVELDMFVGTCLVDMYAKCGSLDYARQVFDRLPTKNVVTWNAMIAGYAQHGLCQEALALYARMQQDGMKRADQVTFLSLIKACAGVKALDQGKHLHLQIRERGLETDLVLGSSLVDMYSKCGSLADARRVFDMLPVRDVVTWTAMISGYAQHGLCQEALALFAAMQQNGMTPANRVTFLSLLQACGSIGALHQGKQLHAQIQQRGLGADLVLGNCLVDMYAKCGSLVDARKVFDRLSTRSVVAWNAMMAGYAQHGLGQEALALYGSMQEDGMTPADDVTFISVLQACATVGALDQGKQLHAEIQARGLEGDVIIGTCLVDMYAKCGRLQEARRLLDTLSTRNVVTWTAMINGYAEHGEAKMAIRCFEEMRHQGVEPNCTTFSCLFVACSHDGLVNEGHQYFSMMVEHYGIVPTAYHYNCMIDLLARSGHLDEAESLLRNVPCQNDVVGWRSLLSACKSYGDIERGFRCFELIRTLEPEDASAYVLMAKIYANAARWVDVDGIERLRLSAHAIKKPAKACIEVKNKVHEFLVGESRDDIGTKLTNVNLHLKEEGGHVPHTQLILKAISEKGKEDALCGHAEKLALAYGLLNTPDGTTLLVNKNLRMCDDCHSGTKIMSRLENREIVVRDAHRVHRFVGGLCSCGDRH